ncbi:MAG: glycosyltransferase family 4 protein [Desulfomonile tiedjei]|nr:glycosyltransferase family 4 protein [Desulfomonile tiedjei]
MVIYGSLDIVTGGFLYDRMLVEHLRSNGDSVEVFSLPWRHYPAHLLDNASGSLLHTLSDADVDLLLQDELNHPSLFLVNRRLKQRLNRPIVSIVHHLRSCELRPDWQNALYRLVEKSYLSTADAFIFNSETTRSAVRRLIGERTRSVVAYPGRDKVKPEIDASGVRRRAEARGPLRVLFVGSLIPRKELHTLIAALALLPKDLAVLDVVGSLTTDPPYVSDIRRQIERLALTECVRLLGTVTGSDLETHYSESHVLAVPSSYEGFGIVYLEGMGFGLPGIASSAGAAHEIITHGEDGFLVTPGDAATLAQHLEKLATDREEVVQLGVNALGRYARHPTWGESCETIAQFLRQIVNTSGLH